MLALDAYPAIRIEMREKSVVLAGLNRPEKRTAADDIVHGERTQLPRQAGSLDSRCVSRVASTNLPARSSATCREWVREQISSRGQ